MTRKKYLTVKCGKNLHICTCSVEMYM